LYRKQYDMNREDILNTLKEGANFTINENGFGYGSINHFPECNMKSEKCMSPLTYYNIHYPTKARLLESLPWNVVKNPRNPEEGEYPSEDGDYITMMDCDEHAVHTNTFKDGHFIWMDRTHIKWWMKLPEK